MNIKPKQKIECSTNDISGSIKRKDQYYIQFAHFSKEVEIFFHKLLTRTLASYDLLYLKSGISTILKELITNATKANIKRLYFAQKGLDISLKADYISGMDTFKEDCLRENAPILDQLEKSNFRVRILFLPEGDLFSVKIINNIQIAPEELKKIEARISKAYKYSDITDAFNDVLDDSEGAGLGLIMAMLIFKNSGFEKKDFSITSGPKQTVCTIRISNTSNKIRTREIAKEIIDDVEYLPSFPENIITLTELCDTPDSTIQEISNYVKKDPSLAASILKQANSVGYLTSNKVTTIEEAIMKIGLAGIKALAIAASIEKIVDERYSQYKDLWETSYRKAFYAYKIAIQLKDRKLAEKAYLSSLLSKIGEIALLSAKKLSMERINKIAGIKEITSIDLLQEISLGISHPTLSAMITEKWNFDSELTNAIKYHLRPHMAPKEIKELIYIIYLAHILIEFEHRNILYQSLDFDVLKFFNLKTEEELKKLHSILHQAYSKNM
ncbi:MAG: HDOD domain-containing protein [Spirochaetes bacterium]|nr:HDOD domain-containing protein [Spirochaetota bacterium]MBN2772519.1 HDOD domain-containing protein [Spirochaetota bacterium]